MFSHLTLRQKVELLVKALAHVWWERLKLYCSAVTTRKWKRKQKRQYRETLVRYELAMPEIKGLLWIVGLANILIVAVVFLSIGWTAWWAFEGVPRLADPIYQNAVPTAVSTVAPRSDHSKLSALEWLSPQEVLELRKEWDVINLVVIDGSNAKYARDVSVALNEKWVKNAPFKIKELSVNGTVVRFTTINEDRFVLNVLQPFIFQDQPELVYLVDQTGQGWSAQLSEIELEDLEKARQSLQIRIDPNPELSFSN